MGVELGAGCGRGHAHDGTAQPACAEAAISCVEALVSCVVAETCSPVAADASATSVTSASRSLMRSASAVTCATEAAIAVGLLERRRRRRCRCPRTPGARVCTRSSHSAVRRSPSATASPALAASRLDLPDEGGDLRGRLLGLLGERADLGGHDREAAAVVAGARGLDGGVQRRAGWSARRCRRSSTSSPPIRSVVSASSATTALSPRRPRCGRPPSPSVASMTAATPSSVTTRASPRPRGPAVGVRARAARGHDLGGHRAHVVDRRHLALGAGGERAGRARRSPRSRRPSPPSWWRPAGSRGELRRADRDVAQQRGGAGAHGLVGLDRGGGAGADLLRRVLDVAELVAGTALQRRRRGGHLARERAGRDAAQPVLEAGDLVVADRVERGADAGDGAADGDVERGEEVGGGEQREERDTSTVRFSPRRRSSRATSRRSSAGASASCRRSRPRSPRRRRDRGRRRPPRAMRLEALRDAGHRRVRGSVSALERLAAELGIGGRLRRRSPARRSRRRTRRCSARWRRRGRSARRRRRRPRRRAGRPSPRGPVSTPGTLVITSSIT